MPPPALTIAFGHIAEAITARDHPQHALLVTLYALDDAPELHRALIDAAGEHCANWNTGASTRRHGARLDYQRGMRAA